MRFFKNGLLAAGLCVGMAGGVARADFVTTLNTIANTDKISYWNLNESSGTTAADAWAGFDGFNTGTYSGTVSVGAAGPNSSSTNNAGQAFIGFSDSNKAASFTAGQLEMDPSTYAGATGELTMTFWFNVSTTTGQMFYGGLHATSGENRYGFAVNSNTNLRAYTVLGDGDDPENEANVNSGSSGIVKPTGVQNYRDGVWHHLVMTVSAENNNQDHLLTVYVDGLERFSATNNTTGDITNTPDWKLSVRTTENLIFGRDAGQPRDLIGLLDEIAFVNRALTLGEVEQLYASAFVQVPEPASIALVGAGLASLVMVGRRARRS